MAELELEQLYCQELDGLVAAGSVVTKDVEGGTIVAGNPAKVFLSVPEEQLLKNQ